MLLDLYDLDGTLTQPGCDLWAIVTRKLCADPAAFDLIVEAWEQEGREGGAAAQTQAKAFMERGLALMIKDVDGAVVRSVAQGSALSLIECGMVHHEAMAFIQSRIDQGVVPVLTTTNYQEVGLGFIDALLAAGMLSKHSADKIRVAGSVVDWSSRSVQHINAGQGKLIGAAKALGLTLDDLHGRVVFGIGDDPAVNDAAILEIAQAPRVVRNERNTAALLAEPCKYFEWSDWDKALVA